MAIFNPTLEVIMNLKEQPSKAEWHVLSFLEESLDDSYEVYFKPVLNGDTPDVVIMKKFHGILIIQINEWNLDDYVSESNKLWRQKESGVRFISPFDQVEKFKNELYNLHIGELFVKKLINRNYWKVVKCMVYFHLNHDADINKKIESIYGGNDLEYFKRYIDDFGALNKTSLNEENFMRVWSKFGFNQRNGFFEEGLHSAFFRHLQAPLHRIEDGIPITYSKSQQAMIKSESGKRRKIKGVAGSGKTMVLAKLAVNAHLRTGGKVLILTYNISLINYIQDRINDVREEFFWHNFIITNYHQFFKYQAKKYSLPIDDLSCWENVGFFRNVASEIQKFDVVLIDEIQDYMQEWIDIVYYNFVNPNSEFIVFGDEKQNIYERELDDKKQIRVRSVRGEWKSLNEARRFNGTIAELATSFQKEFFIGKYDTDQINIAPEFDFQSNVIEYHYFDFFDPVSTVDLIYSVMSKHKIHSSDACIQSSKIEHLRLIDKYIREKRREETTRMFESFEEYEKFGNNKEMIEDIRKMKKKHFLMKTGTVKISTIHSFKGWDIDTLFLLLFERDNKNVLGEDELTYTGLTRAKKNIVLINIKNTRYDKFFSMKIKNLKYEKANYNFKEIDPLDLDLII